MPDDAFDDPHGLWRREHETWVDDLRAWREEDCWMTDALRRALEGYDAALAAHEATLARHKARIDAHERARAAACDGDEEHADAASEHLREREAHERVAAHRRRVYEEFLALLRALRGDGVGAAAGRRRAG